MNKQTGNTVTLVYSNLFYLWRTTKKKLVSLQLAKWRLMDEVPNIKTDVSVCRLISVIAQVRGLWKWVRKKSEMMISWEWSKTLEEIPTLVSSSITNSTRDYSGLNPGQCSENPVSIRLSYRSIHQNNKNPTFGNKMWVYRMRNRNSDRNTNAPGTTSNGQDIFIHILLLKQTRAYVPYGNGVLSVK
jgi:hypothetical protein